MESAPRPLRRRLAGLVSTAGATLWILAGCGPGDAPADFGIDEHTDIAIASTQPGRGALAADYDFSRPIEISSSQCIGGSGTACEGGILLYSTEDPGFAPLQTDRAGESLYVLEEGTPVTIALSAATAGASLFLDGVSLSRPGDSVLIGQAVGGLHRHGSWQIAVAAGEPPASSYVLTFTLTTSAAQYVESESYTITLVPISGGT